ncbi:DUF2061 domain-containing protein [Roseibium algae]|uniref:DUF2061 domain-containing protein n=1 Tax=Roseibium algae TaxID=3123038 RepID=A0ABU8TH00_9HYPH
MDTTKRTLLKAVTWQLLGLITVTALSYPATGSLWAAMALALSASVTGFVAFFIHEKIWNRVSWGQSPHINKRPAEVGRPFELHH